MKATLAILLLFHFVLLFPFHYDNAAHALQEGNFQQAHSMLQPLIIDNPDKADLLYDTGVAAYNMEKYTQAQAYFSRAAENAKTDDLKCRALFNAGNACVALKELNKALEYYDAVLAIDEHNEYALYNKERVLEMLKQQEQQQEQQDQSDKNKEQQKDKQDNNKDQQKNDDQQQDKNQQQDQEQSSDNNSDEQQQGNNQENNKQDKNQQQNDKQQEQSSDSQKNKDQQPSSDEQDGSDQSEKESDQKERGDSSDSSKSDAREKQRNEKNDTKDANDEEQRKGERQPHDGSQDKQSEGDRQQSDNHNDAPQNQKNIDDLNDSNVTPDEGKEQEEQLKKDVPAAVGQSEEEMAKSLGEKLQDPWLVNILKKQEERDKATNKQLMSAKIRQNGGKNVQNNW